MTRPSRGRRMLVAVAPAVAVLALAASARAVDVWIFPWGIDRPFVVADDESVHWRNTTLEPQRVAAGDGTFDSGQIPPGGGYSLRLLAPGDHEYTVSPAGFTGTVSVPVPPPPTHIEGPPGDPVADHIPDLAFPAHVPGDRGPDPELGVGVSKSRILVMFGPTASVAEANAALEGADVDVIGGIPMFGLLLVQSHAPDAGLSDVDAFARRDAAVASLQASGAVATAALDVDVELASTPPSPEPFEYTWKDDDQNVHTSTAVWEWGDTVPNGPLWNGDNWYLEADRAPQAWNLNQAIEAKDPRLDVVVIDTGVDTGHTEVADVVSQQLCTTSGRCTVQTPDEHGTHVAGTVGGSAEDGVGTNGIDRFARIHNVGLAFDSGEVSFADTAEIFKLVLAEASLLGAFPDLRVINYSARVKPPSHEAIQALHTNSQGVVVAHCGEDADDDGKPGSTDNCSMDNDDTWLKKLAEWGKVARGIAASASARDVVIVQAAGNESNKFCVHVENGVCAATAFVRAQSAAEFVWASKHWGASAFPNPVVGVEATHKTLGLAEFSNHSGDISAPGLSIVNADAGGGYKMLHGTSMAAPQVTGALAYLLAYKSDLTVEAAKHALTEWGAESGLTFGQSRRLDLFASLMSLPGAAKDLVDVSDRSADGNARTRLDPEGSVDIGPLPIRPDDHVDMKDFRAFRDAWLQSCLLPPATGKDAGCPADGDIKLDGGLLHGKRDLNLDGCVNIDAELQPDCPTPEGTFSRFDFNGDGVVQLDTTSGMPIEQSGAVGESMTELTDLEVLQSQWTGGDGGEGWTPSDLQDLMRSGELEIHADALFNAGASEVEVKMTASNGQPLPTRTIEANLRPEKALVVATVPAGSGTTVELEATSTVAGETISAAPIKVELKLGEDRRIDLCKSLTVTATPEQLAAEGNQKATVVAQLHKCSDVEVANRTIAWELDDAAAGTLSHTESTTGSTGAATTTLTAGTTPGTYKLKATVTLDDGVTDTAEIEIELRPKVTVKYVWKQHIVEWLESGSTKWTDAPPGMPDCTVPGVIGYCIDSFALKLLSEEGGGVERAGTLSGGGTEFSVTDQVSNSVVKSQKDWTLTRTDGSQHTGSAISTFHVIDPTRYLDEPVDGVVSTFTAHGLHVDGLEAVGSLPYTYSGSYMQTGAGNVLDPMELPDMLANLLLVPQPPEQPIRFAANPAADVVFAHDPATDDYLPFQSCGRLVDDLTSEPGYLVLGPSIPGLPAIVLGRKTTYVAGDRPMPVGPGNLTVDYSFGAVVSVGAAPPLEPALPDCSINNTPSAKFDAPPTAQEGRPTQFLDVSTDVDNDIEEYHWDFGDGEPASTQRNPHHAFPDDGTYTVTLTVTDREGATDSFSKQIAVENRAPLAYIDDATAEHGTPLEFNFGTWDAGKVDKQSLEWTITSTNPAWPGLSNTQPAFDGGYQVLGLPVGVYPVTLTVKDKDGGTTSAQATFEVTKEPPPVCDPATGANCPPPPPPVFNVVCGGGAQLDGEESAFLDLVNAYRIQNGVPPLVGVSPTLQQAASEHAHDMAVNDFMGHVGSDGRDPAQRAVDAGYPAGATLSENVASGMSEAFHALWAWKSSTSGHNENMLDPAWKAIGIAREEGNGTWRWATTYGDVLDCAAPPAPESAPDGDGFATLQAWDEVPMASAEADADTATGAAFAEPILVETGVGVQTIELVETIEVTETESTFTVAAAAPAADEASSFGPGAAFTISTVNPTRGKAVTLTNRSRDAAGTPVGATVDFGDGTAPVPLGPDESTVHRFAQQGILVVVSLTASDAAGRATTVERTLSVAPPPAPLLAYTGASQGVSGKTLAVAAKLTDEDTDAPIAGAQIAFALGSKTVAATTDATGTATASVDLSGVAPGSYTLTLSFAGNQEYAPRQASRAVTVIANAPPDAHPGGPYVLGSGGTLLLDGGRSSDPDAGDSVAAWDWDLNGDGHADVAGRTPRPLGWSELQTLLCAGTCVAEHEYPVTLTVTDTRGESRSASTFVRFTSDFALFLGSETKTLVPGQTSHFAVNVVASTGFTTPVTLSAVGLPVGVTASFTPSIVTPPGVSVLRLTAAAGTSSGTFPVRVRGTAGSVVREVSDEVVVAFGLVPVCHATAEGTVVDGAGAPVAGVQVMNTRTFVPETTDVNGRFTIRNLPLGFNNAPSTVSITATKAGYWDVSATGSTACGATTRFSLTLVSKLKGRVSGVVREGTVGSGGQVVATADPVPNPVIVFDNAQIFTGDVSGAYAVDVDLSPNNAARGYSPTASAPGFWHQQKSVVADAAVPKQVDFVLVRQCKATLVGGTVRYADGTPVANHLVAFDPDGSGFSQVSATTDANGTFTFNRELLLGYNNAARTIFVRVFPNATDPPGTQTGVFSWPLSTCGERSSRDLTFQRPVARRGSFEGTVREEETGVPVAGVSVSGYADSNLPGNTAPFSVSTDAEGRFRVDDVLIGYDVATAVRTITLTKQGYHATFVNTTLRADQTTRVDFTVLGQRFGAVQGVVRDAATRQPIPGARLNPIFPLSCAQFFCATTGAEGTYSSQVALGFRNAPVTDTVRVTADGYWDRQVTVSASAGTTTTADVDMLRKCTPARIVGTVVNALTQAPIRNADVRAGTASASTDELGRFVLEGIQPGTTNNPLQVQVTASATGFISQSKLVTIFCGAMLVVDFGSAQPALGVIVGRVTDADTGQPLAGAFVGSEFGGSATTDANGEYRIASVPLGADSADRQWRITARPTGYRPRTQLVTAKADVDVRADFAFSKLGNHRPVATPRSFSVNENGRVALSFAGTDEDGDELVFYIATLPAHGTLSGAPPNAEYVPNRDYDGPDSFTYTAFDGHDLSEPATVRIDVVDVNRPPVARTDVFTVTAGRPATLDVLANDTDPDGDPLSVIGVAARANTNGSLAIADGKVVYTPAVGFLGAGCFDYTVGDGKGGIATAFVCVEVVPGGSGDRPTCAAVSWTVAEDAVLDGAVTCDGGSGPLAYAVAEQPAHGTLTLDPSGTFRYVPDADYSGSDSFAFTASDGTNTSEPAVATIGVTPVNDPPVAVDDSYALDEDTTLVLEPGVLANDVDVDGDVLTAEVVDQPDHGTLMLLPSGGLAYTPASNFHGADTFTYRASDGTASSTAEVTLTIRSVNDPPACADVDLATDEGTPVTHDYACLDVDGDALSYTFSEPAHGTVAGSFTYTPARGFHGVDSFEATASDGIATGSATITVTVAPVEEAPVARDDEASVAEDETLVLSEAQLLANDDVVRGSFGIVSVGAAVNGAVELVGGEVRFRPRPDYFGRAQFAYTIADGGGRSATAQVLVEVTPVNDEPVARDDAVATDEDERLELAAAALLANDSDVDGDGLVLATVGGAEHGSVTLAGDEVVFVPEADHFGAAGFSYTIDDGQGGTSTARVVVTVRPVNDAPVCVDVAFEIDEDTEGSGPADCTDVDGDTLELSVDAPLTADGTRIRYAPPPNRNGFVTATYRVADGNGGNGSASVDVFVRPVNDRPSARDGAVSLDEDDPPVAIDLDTLVDDVETADEHLEYEIVAAPANGGLTLAGSVARYDSNRDFHGGDSFAYRVLDRGDPDGCDGDRPACDRPAASETHVVRFSVAPVNDAPSVDLAGGTVADEGGAAVTLTASASDVDGDPLAYSWTTDHGSVSGSGPTVAFSADDGPATANVHVEVSDGHGGTSEATHVVAVRNVPPTADAGPDVTGPWGVALRFAGEASDPSAADRAAGLSPLWWFGDGGESSGATASYAYAAPGDFTATFAVVDKDGGAAADTTSVSVSRRASAIEFTGTRTSLFAETVLSARLSDTVDAATAELAGHDVTFTIGGSTFIARTDAAGVATVSPPPSVTSGTLRVSFAGGRLYSPSATEVEMRVEYDFAGSGAFAVGGSPVLGSKVTFWSSRWDAFNGFGTPSSFKGFVAGLVEATCGVTWATAPANSPGPPATLPKHMAVIVPTAIAKSGSTISGDVGRVVVVRVDPGYAPAPGHDGTGTVVATVC